MSCAIETPQATVSQLATESYVQLLDPTTGRIRTDVLPSLLFWPPNPSNNQLIRNSEMHVAIDKVYTSSQPNLAVMQQTLASVGMTVAIAAEISDLQARADTLRAVVQQQRTLMSMRVNETLKELTFPAPRIGSIVSRGPPINTSLVKFRHLFAPRCEPAKVTLQAYRSGPNDTKTILSEVTVDFAQQQVVEFGGFGIYFHIRAQALYPAEVTGGFVASEWLDAPQSAYEDAL